MAEDKRTGRHLVIHGKVQGVWYRGWAVDTARSIGLAGWVRNRLDGTVEAVIIGTEADIERFIGLAHDGPKAARVDRIDVVPAAHTDCTGFEQRPTA
jgi:acylphosphatase